MKKVIYIGQLTDASGYGNASRKYLSVLDKYLDHNQYLLKAYNSSYERQNFASEEENKMLNKYLLDGNELQQFISSKDYTAIYHLLPTDCFLNTENYKNKLIYDNAKKRINLSYWESDRIPKEWRKTFSDKVYDNVILACEWNKEIYSKDCPVPISVIPIPKNNAELEKKQNDIFTIFSMSQWQYRKGIDILIKAFYQEFFDHEDVKLFIKTDRAEAGVGVDVNYQRQAIFNEAASYKASVVHYEQQPKCKLEILTGVIPHEQIMDLYAKGDVFCLPTRGEGFGLTIADAALYGIPCIVPDKGGHLDFLDKENSFLAVSQYRPLENMFFKHFSSKEMNFLETDILSLRSKMREAYELWKKDRATLLKMGLENKKHAKQHLNEKRIFDEFIKVL